MTACLILSLLLAGQMSEADFVQIVKSKGPDEAAAVFHGLRQSHPGARPFAEATMNNLGYELVQKKDFAGAIKLFTLNVEAYPASANAEDSLGEAYADAGNKDEAAKHYRRSLSMAPGSDRQIQILKDLGHPVSQQEWTGMIRRLMPPDVEFRPNVVYASPQGLRLRMDLIRPKGFGRKLPALVFLHGGGWSAGTKERGDLPLVYFAQHGFVAGSVEYRLAPKFIFPTQVQDVKRAIQYLRRQAAALGIDPNRIAVWGQSAGGHLAAMAGTTAGTKFFDPTGVSTRVQAVIDWNGPANFESDPKALKETGPTANGINRFVGGALKDHLRVAKLANPIRYVSAGDPPFLIVHGDKDSEVPLSESQALLAALRQHRVPARLVVLKGEDHFGPDEVPLGLIAHLQHNDPAALAETMLNFLREALKVAPPPRPSKRRTAVPAATPAKAA